MTVIINNDMFYLFFPQRGSADQSSAAASKSHSTVFQVYFAQFWYFFYNYLMLILQSFVKVLDLDKFNI